jgi:NADPH2:quinone reductase
LAVGAVRLCWPGSVFADAQSQDQAERGWRIMNYAVVQAFGGSEQIQFFESPDPLVTEGKLLIEIRSAGMNFADVMARTGIYPSIPRAPFRPGFEIAGLVKSVGRGVSGFSVGDRVAAITLAGGGYSTHAVVAADTAIKLPLGFDYDIAAALMVQGLTAYLVLKEAGLTQGETVLISAAAGGLGSLAVQIAKKLGATVIGLASKAKHKFVKERGADVAIDYTNSEWSKAVLSATDNQGVNVYLDSQGDLEQGVASMAKLGRWFLYGARDQRATSTLSSHFLVHLLENNVTLRGYTVESSFQHFALAINDLFAWAADGSLKIDVTRYPLRDAAKAQDDFAARRTTGKVILKPFE